MHLICIHYLLPDNKLQFNPRRGGSHSAVINKWLATCIIYQTAMPSSSSAMEISLFPDLFIHPFYPSDAKWSTVSHLWQYSFTLLYIALCDFMIWDHVRQECKMKSSDHGDHVVNLSILMWVKHWDHWLFGGLFLKSFTFYFIYFQHKHNVIC